MSSASAADVMQVCLGGHVITESLAVRPEQRATHCPCCGASTITQCATCGHAIPGAEPVPGMPTVGTRRPPRHCGECGAAFPWARDPVDAPLGATIATLAALLRRLPRAIAQLRDRRDGRPTLRVGDVHDVEDLVRAILHLHFTDVRRENRTPKYAADTRTDFLLAPERIALTLKLATTDVDTAELRREIQQDRAYYAACPHCDYLLVLVYDPEQRVHDPQPFEISSTAGPADLHVCCVVAS